jgi:hypothetical protein
MQLSNNIILPTLYIIENKENNLYAHFALDVLRYYKPLAEEEKTTTIANQSHYSQRLKDY